MIAGIFHEGSGLGDQLFRYITVRTLAEKKGYDWCMLNNRQYPETNFKGDGFLQIDYASSIVPGNTKERWVAEVDESKFQKWLEKDVRDANGTDIRSYDPEINFVEDNTVIDGSFEDDKYWRHNLHNIDKWLAVEPLNVPDDICVIGFRGGEYASQPDLFLTPDYYREAMAQVAVENGVQKFEVHTDDIGLAKEFFGKHGFKDMEYIYIDNPRISHSKHENMGFNWRSARYAKYAIIPNSAFFILPRILKHHEDPAVVTLAPRWWARRNTKGPWRPAAYYNEFTYV